MNKSRSEPILSGSSGEERLEAFELQWLSGKVPDLSRILGSSQPPPIDLQWEFVLIDLECRWRNSVKDAHPETIDTQDATATEFSVASGTKLASPESQTHRTNASQPDSLPARPRLEDYMVRFPGLGSIESLSVERIADEFRIRRRIGDQPTSQEYLQRFPKKSDSLSLALSAVEEQLATEATLHELESGQAGGPKTDGNDIKSQLVAHGYQIEKEIARGGMGVVYRARQIKLDRVVALKMILAGPLASSDAKRRFKIEAEAAANLEHPGIVPIYEIGEHNDLPFFSMAFIDGESLAAIVKDGPMPPRDAATITHKIALAIGYAHDRGIIHRDLKPANILIDRNGEPRVTDFGLARRTDADIGLTASGDVLGTPAYMPPEQASGSGVRNSPALDIYSLGAVLYAAVTGRPPFQATSMMDALTQVRENIPIAPRQLVSTLDQDIETICLKCLEKEPSKRYASAAELAEELQRYLAGEPIKARPISKWERAWRWCKRKPTVAALVAVGLMLLLVLSIGGPLVALAQADNAREQKLLRFKADSQAQRADREAKSARKNAQDAIDAQQREAAQRAIAERNARDALRQVYVADIQRAAFEVEQGNLYEAQLALERHHPKDDGQDLRGWEWYYLRSQCSRETTTLRMHTSIVDAVAWHPSENVLASFSSYSGRLIVHDVQNEITQLDINDPKIKVSTATPHLAWSVQANYLLVVMQAGSKVSCRIWNVEKGRVAIEFTENILHAAWNPTKEEATILLKDGTLKLWNAETGNETEFVALSDPIADGRNARLVWSPDGSHLVVEHSKQVEIFSVDESKSVLKIARSLQTTRIPSNFTSHGCAWSPNSQFLVLAMNPLYLRVVDLQNTSENKLVYLLLQNHRIGDNPCFSWSPDSDQVAFLTTSSVVVVDDINERSRPYPAVFESGTVHFGVVWHADGEHLLTYDDTGRLDVWNAQSGRIERFGAHTSRIYSAVWNHDRTLMATCGGDTAIRLWNPSGIVPARHYAFGPMAWDTSRSILFCGSNSIDLSSQEQTQWVPNRAVEPAGAKELTRIWTDWHTANPRGRPRINHIKWDSDRDELVFVVTLDRRTERVNNKYVTTHPGGRFLARWSSKKSLHLVRKLDSAVVGLGENDSLVVMKAGAVVRWVEGHELAPWKFDREQLGFPRILDTAADGRSSFLFSKQTMEFFCVDLVRGQTAWEEKIDASVTQCAVSQDSKLICHDLVDSDNGVLKLVLRRTSDGTIVKQVTAHALPPTEVGKEPNGCGFLVFGNDRLVSGLNQEVKVWSLDLEELLRLRRMGIGDAMMGSFSPDQKVLAIGFGGNIAIFDSSRGHENSKKLDDAFFIRKVPAFGGGGFF